MPKTPLADLIPKTPSVTTLPMPVASRTVRGNAPEAGYKPYDQMKAEDTRGEWRYIRRRLSEKKYAELLKKHNIKKKNVTDKRAIKELDEEWQMLEEQEKRRIKAIPETSRRRRQKITDRVHRIFNEAWDRRVADRLKHEERYKLHRHARQLSKKVVEQHEQLRQEARELAKEVAREIATEKDEAALLKKRLELYRKLLESQGAEDVDEKVARFAVQIMKKPSGRNQPESEVDLTSRLNESDAERLERLTRKQITDEEAAAAEKAKHEKLLGPARAAAPRIAAVIAAEKKLEEQKRTAWEDKKAKALTLYERVMSMDREKRLEEARTRRLRHMVTPEQIAESAKYLPLRGADVPSEGPVVQIAEIETDPFTMNDIKYGYRIDKFKVSPRVQITGTRQDLLNRLNIAARSRVAPRNETPEIIGMKPPERQYDWELERSAPLKTPTPITTTWGNRKQDLINLQHVQATQAFEDENKPRLTWFDMESIAKEVDEEYAMRYGSPEKPVDAIGALIAVGKNMGMEGKMRDWIRRARIQEDKIMFRELDRTKAVSPSQSSSDRVTIKDREIEDWKERNQNYFSGYLNRINEAMAGADTNEARMQIFHDILVSGRSSLPKEFADVLNKKYGTKILNTYDESIERNKKRNPQFSNPRFIGIIPQEKTTTYAPLGFAKGGVINTKASIYDDETGEKLADVGENGTIETIEPTGQPQDPSKPDVWVTPESTATQAETPTMKRDRQFEQYAAEAKAKDKAMAKATKERDIRFEQYATEAKTKESWEGRTSPVAAAQPVGVVNQEPSTTAPKAAQPVVDAANAPKTTSPVTPAQRPPQAAPQQPAAATEAQQIKPRAALPKGIARRVPIGDGFNVDLTPEQLESVKRRGFPAWREVLRGTKGVPDEAYDTYWGDTSLMAANDVKRMQDQAKLAGRLGQARDDLYYSVDHGGRYITSFAPNSAERNAEAFRQHRMKRKIENLDRRLTRATDRGPSFRVRVPDPDLEFIKKQRERNLARLVR